MKQCTARLLAAAARLGADTAVFMPRGMVLTFLCTNPAGLGAGHQLRLHQHWARACQTCDDACCGKADVRAVEAGSDAADEVGHVSLAQAGIGTAGTQATALIAGRRARLNQ
jgi:sorbitol-specific phosphotransferase system component IIA